MTDGPRRHTGPGGSTSTMPESPQSKNTYNQQCQIQSACDDGAEISQGSTGEIGRAAGGRTRTCRIERGIGPDGQALAQRNEKGLESTGRENERVQRRSRSMEIGTCTTTLSLTEKINCTATRGFGGFLGSSRGARPLPLTGRWGYVWW